jgi:hypothetical protein
MRVRVSHTSEGWQIQSLDGEVIEYSPRVLLADAEASGNGFIGELSSLGDEARAGAPLDQEAYALHLTGGRYVYLGNQRRPFDSAPYLYLSIGGQALALPGGS